MEGRADVVLQGNLRELVGKRWKLRSWKLVNNKLASGRRSFALDECEVSEQVEPVDIEKRRMYMFEIAMPLSAAHEEFDEDEEEKEEDCPDSDDENDNKKKNRTAAPFAGKKKHIFHHSTMPSECSTTRKTTGRSLLTMGAAVVALGVGAVVVGATTLGLGLVPYAAFSVVAVGSGSALTRKGLGENRRYLVLASQSKNAAKRWRDEISRAAAAARLASNGGSERPSKPPRQWSWGEGRADASRRRGIVVQKKRVGSGTLVCAKIAVRAKPLDAFLALLGDDDSRLLSNAGGVVGAVERIQRIDESSDIAKISLRPLVPSTGNYYARKATAALAAAAGLGRSLLLALASAVVALFKVRHPARRRLLKEARILFFKAIWLAWASLSVAPFPARDFRVRREWQVTDHGIYVVDITSSENEEEAEELLSAQFSVAPVDETRGDQRLRPGNDDDDDARSSLSTSFCQVVVWLRLQLPGRLARTRHTSTIFGRAWDGVASLYAEEVALSIVDLKIALDNLHSSRNQTKTTEEQIVACRQRIKEVSAAVAGESDAIARRERSRELQRALAEECRLVRLAHDGEDSRFSRREMSRLTVERTSDEAKVDDGEKTPSDDDRRSVRDACDLFRLIPLDAHRSSTPSAAIAGTAPTAAHEGGGVVEWVFAILAICVIFSLAPHLFG